MREQAFCWNNSFKRAALFLFLVYSLAGCDSYETHTLSGEITEVNKEEKIIQIDGKPIKLYFVDAYEIGQRVTATFIDKTPGKDCWCPDDFEVKDIKILEDDNRKD
ncbi:hypothetical protein ABE41_005855 [Fictibacillus arsenicus]|uniref:DUF3221 domain-containing protein n=1 Tax=Fictibacillus arsenicus TaxID=255247 RepID=A0A1B1Z226_9BACL|nr:hypothetical protein [Fictibacillus arsenicus]ANX11525.1 hypothetical protein ABE41_005855 [Fictibacillus arsenicus]